MKKLLLVLGITIFFLTFASAADAQTCSTNQCGSTCYGSCPDGTSFYCSAGPDYATACCPNTMSCPFCGGKYYLECTSGEFYCINGQAYCLAPTPTPIPSPTPTPTLAPQVPTGEAPTTFTIADGYSNTQGPIWYYYYTIMGSIPLGTTLGRTEATYGTAKMLAKEWFGQPDNLYWTAGPDSWLWIDPNMNTGGDGQAALIYWKAPKKGLSEMTVTDQRIGPSAKGDGYTFGAGYALSVGDWPTSFLKTITLPSTNLDLQSFTISQQMRGNGDALMYFKDQYPGDSFGDEARYTISITFTPTQDATGPTPTPTLIISPTPTSTIAPTPTPTLATTPTPTPNPLSCGSGDPRATGLVSTANLLPGSNFGSTGACVIDPKAAFAPLRIPNFLDLKSLYFNQK